MSYTSPLLVSAYLKRELTSNESVYLSILLPAVDKWINNYTDSSFSEVSETTRYYDGGSNSIDIDPCTDITSVQAIDWLSDPQVTLYTYLPTEYTAEPVNETVKNEIRRRYGCFGHGTNRIAVTAKFSEYDGAVPTDIQIAATRIAAGLFDTTSKTDDDGNAIKSESIEGHSITYGDTDKSVSTIGLGDPVVMGILGAHRETLVG